MKDIIEKCKTTRILATIGIIGLFLGTIMPYVKILGYKISLYNYWEGKIVIILAIANLLFIFKDVVKKYVPSIFNTGWGQKIDNMENPKYTLVPTIIAAAFALYLTIELGTRAFKYYSIGFYCLWIGVISLVAFAFLHRKDDFNFNNNPYDDNNNFNG